MGDASRVEGAPAAAAGNHSSSATQSSDSLISANFVKGVLGVTSLTSFLAAIRSAWKHTRTPDSADLARAQVISGVGFASRALALATILTVSGFSLVVVGVSYALDVNTPRQFGRAMRDGFGDALRLPQSKNSQSFEDLLLEIEKRTGQSAKLEQPAAANQQ